MVLIQGPLLKWTNMMKGYQQRWFVLDEINGLLSYYTSQEKLIRGDRRGCIRLIDAILGIEDDDETTFSITAGNKVFHCKANSVQERDEWVNHLADIIQLNQKRRRRRYKSSGKTHNTDFAFVPLKKRNIHEFNKKLIETDSYLQILIKQFQKLDSKILKNDEIVDQSLSNSEQQRNHEQLLKLKKLSGYYLDSIKHTIVLLQISKNIKYPLNGIFTDKDQQLYSKKNYVNVGEDQASIVVVGDGSNNGNTGGLNKLPDLKSSYQSNVIDVIPVDAATTNLANDCLTTFPATSALEAFSDLSEQYNKTYPVPDISYASSQDDDDDDDDDDFFFDANDQQQFIANIPSDSEESVIIADNDKLAQFSPGFNSSDSSAVIAVTTTTSTMPSTKKANSVSSYSSVNSEIIDWDKLYETDTESDDLGSLSSNGSVISHLLSQVRIGMDLTKVTLPTFILERRSLLEMYADFFAHADIFVSIPDYKTPKERMVQVVKWYLSSFHAGRKGSIAKKPYNPILGEIFKCHWKLTPDNSKSESCSKDGPIPWAGSKDLVFIAEQVSHHPPISAFYAESADKRIMCCAQIYTKSKFLGLSIGVNNIGQGSIYLVDYDEEYTCTFPSAYGRSILTEPWFELGGSALIECRKTGYLAKIDFQTKPFYGGKKHQIKAEVYEPNKKLFLSITGEWNGKMEAKWISNGSTTKTETFIDTKTMPIIKKQVKPIKEQEDCESRNIWKKVTLALKRQNVNEASSAKAEIEQRQRDLVKQREERSLKWQNRMFHKVGDKWVFNNPLTSRKTKR